MAAHLPERRVLAVASGELGHERGVRARGPQPLLVQQRNHAQLALQQRQRLHRAPVPADQPTDQPTDQAGEREKPAMLLNSTR